MDLAQLRNIDTVRVPGGCLLMGSNQEEIDLCVSEWAHRLVKPEYAKKFRSWIEKEHPQHRVVIDDLEVWRFPVRNDQFRPFNSINPALSLSRGEPDDHPVWGVTLADATSFAALSGGWRLPTEAEWEWIAAGPERFTYPYGNKFDVTAANTRERHIGATTAVTAHPHGASWCGVMDLAGNVEEWTSSRYSPYPGGRFIADDLVEALGPNYPIIRGGSYELGGDLSRCSRRHGPHPGEIFRAIGVRLVRTLARKHANK